MQLNSLEQVLHEQMGVSMEEQGLAGESCGACPGPDEVAQPFLHLDPQ